MTSLHRVVISWTGPSVVGAAVTVLHWDGSNQSGPPVAGIMTALGSLQFNMPTGVQAVVPNTGDTIDDRTGALTGVWSGTGGGTKSFNGSGNGPAGVGACVGWTTGGIVTGKNGVPRKLRGRTFVVPLAGDQYDANGTLTSAALSGVQAFATNLMAAGPLAVWHRPSTKGAADGNSYAVLSSRVRDKAAFLSSRRD